MSRNPIQSQKGLSLRQLQEKYGTEDQCEAMVRAWRWPDGFVCPHCGSTDHAIVGKRRLYECHECRKQTSLKAGTVFENTMLPLTVWFQGMYLLTQAKNSISGLGLARQLGVRPDTASLMRHKLMSVMVEREGSRKLEGRVEMDDAVLGGVKHLDEGGKRGRNGPNKTPFVVAVETSDDGHPRRKTNNAIKATTGHASFTTTSTIQVASMPMRERLDVGEVLLPRDSRLARDIAPPRACGRRRSATRDLDANSRRRWTSLLPSPDGSERISYAPRP